MEKKINNWTPFLRDYVGLVRKGIINKNEFTLFSWIRGNADPYGIWKSVNLGAIKEDLFPKGSINYINKLFLNLKQKRLIYYDSRSGRRGSFEVHIGDLWLPSGKIKSLDKYFDKKQVRGSDIESSYDNTRPSQILDTQGQRSRGSTNDEKPRANELLIDPKVRGSNNDTDTNNYKENIDVDSLKSSNGRIRVVEFKPNSDEEAWCKRIALELEEKYINFILSAKNKYGIDLVKNAYRVYKDVDSTECIKNPPAYLNKIIKNLADRKNKPLKVVDLRS